MDQAGPPNPKDRFLRTDFRVWSQSQGLGGDPRTSLADPASPSVCPFFSAAEEETPSPTEMEETPSPTEPSTEALEPPEEPLLGELTVTGSSPDSLSLSWTVPQGHFDSFTVQYKNGDGQPQVVRVPGHESGITISGLEPGHKYKMNLYGFHDRQRVGPVSVIGVTSEWTVEASGWDLVGDHPLR